MFIVMVSTYKRKYFGWSERERYVKLVSLLFAVWYDVAVINEPGSEISLTKKVIDGFTTQ